MKRKVRVGSTRNTSTAQVIPDPVETGDKEFRRLLTGFINFRSRPPHRVALTEVLHPADRSSIESQFNEALENELFGLLRTQEFRGKCMEEIKDDTNVLEGPSAIYGEYGNGCSIVNGTFRGTRSHLYGENMFVNWASNAKHVSIRILVTIYSILGYRALMQDFTQAYPQSAHYLIRKLYVQPEKNVRWNPTNC